MPGKDIAIDLGTSKIKVYVRGKGIVLSEANAVTYEAGTNEIIAMGNSAGEMKGKLPDTLETVWPVKNGIISDFSVMRQILEAAIEKVCRREVFKPDIIVSCPVGCTDLQKKTIIDVCAIAGAGKVYVLESPVASALGCAKDIEKPYGVMVIDIGAGTTDIAIITMNTVAYYSSLPIGGSNMDEAVRQYIRKERDILIGKQTAEKIRLSAGCIYGDSEEVELTAYGKDFVSGMPVSFTITSTEIKKALSDVLSQILSEIKSVLEEVPPELQGDIHTEGIILTGGCAYLRGLSEAIKDKTGVEVKVAEDALNTCVKGAGYALKNMKNLEDNGYVFKMKEKDITKI